MSGHGRHGYANVADEDGIIHKESSHSIKACPNRTLRQGLCILGRYEMPAAIGLKNDRMDGFLIASVELFVS